MVIARKTVYLVFAFLMMLACAGCSAAAGAPGIPSTSPVLLPDLRIEDLSVQMQGQQPGECVTKIAPYEIEAVVTNQGQALVERVEVEITGGAREELSALAPGQRHILRFAANAPDGRYSLRADPDNKVAEVDEGNNSLVFSAPTPTPPPFCTLPVATLVPEAAEGISKIPESLPVFHPPADWLRYVHPTAGYTIRYPVNATYSEDQGLLVIRLPLPPKTMLVEKIVQVGSAPETGQGCYSNTPGESEVEVNGIRFRAKQGTFWENEEGGLSVYQGIYAALHERDCYEVRLRMAFKNDSKACRPPTREEMDVEVLLDIFTTLELGRVD